MIGDRLEMFQNAQCQFAESPESPNDEMFQNAQFQFAESPESPNDEMFQNAQCQFAESPESPTDEMFQNAQCQFAESPESPTDESLKTGTTSRVNQVNESFLEVDEERGSHNDEGHADVEELIYKVEDKPPVHLLLLFAMQVCLISIVPPTIVSVLVAEVVCARNDEVIKSQILSAALMMVGIGTFLMSTIGVRLPILQGPTPIYLVYLAAMDTTLEEWTCPPTVTHLVPTSNVTTLYAVIGNGTLVPQRKIIYSKIGTLSGSLMAAGALQSLVGFTGLIGMLTRYVGPVTIVPTILLIGLNLYVVSLRFGQTNWCAAFLTSGTCVALSLFLAKRKMPLPTWNKSKGFVVFWYPLHQVLAILFGVMVGWIASAIMTESGFLSDDPSSKEFLARTDSRTDVIDEIDWFTLPYPGKFGSFSFSSSAFVNFCIITVISIMDSVGDYAACARVTGSLPPPAFAFNRGLAVEGLLTVLSGTMGCCHATVSQGSCIGAIGITRVASRRVYQIAGLLFILFSIIGKFGAIFITIPYAVLGGVHIVTCGIFIGIVLSSLQTIDLNSHRNTAIIGMALLLGFVLPNWIQSNPTGIQTGNQELNNVLKVFISNPSIVGGLFAFILDNSVPGTLTERGLDTLRPKSLGNVEERKHGQGMQAYRLPFLPHAFRRSVFAKYIPLFDQRTRP